MSIKNRWILSTVKHLVDTWASNWLCTFGLFWMKIPDYLWLWCESKFFSETPKVGAYFVDCSGWFNGSNHKFIHDIKFPKANKSMKTFGEHVPYFSNRGTRCQDQILISSCFFKNQRANILLDAAHEKDLRLWGRESGILNILWHFSYPKVFIQDITKC